MNDMTAAGLARVISHACRMAHEDRLSRPCRGSSATVAWAPRGRFYVRLAGHARYLTRVAGGPLGWTRDHRDAERFWTGCAALKAVAHLDGDFVVETVQ